MVLDFVDDFVGLVLDGLLVNGRENWLACSDERAVRFCELRECREPAQVSVGLER